MHMKYKRNGSVVVHHGYWFYSVKLPGAEKRRMLALRAPGAEHGLSADRPREMAEQAAARLWEDACREDRACHGERGATAEAVFAAYCAFARTYYRRPSWVPPIFQAKGAAVSVSPAAGSVRRQANGRPNGHARRQPFAGTVGRPRRANGKNC